MSDRKNKDEMFEILQEDIPRITEKDRSDLVNNITTKMYLNNMEKSFKIYRQSLRFEKKHMRRMRAFLNFINKYCGVGGCYFRQLPSAICTECLLNSKGIRYNFIDGNLFYYSGTLFDNVAIDTIYLSKRDFNEFGKTLMYPPIIVKTPDDYRETSNNALSIGKQVKATNAALATFIRIHNDFFKNNLLVRRNASIILYPRSYQIIASQVAKTIFGLCKAEKIITSNRNWEEEIQQGLSEFGSFLVKQFYLNPGELLNLSISFSNVLEKCNADRGYSPVKPFSKLIRTLYTITEGNILTIKQLAKLIAKIFIGRTCLKGIDADKKINHFTIINSDNSKYIRDFLMDVFTYELSPNNLDYSSSIVRRVTIHRSKVDKLVSEHKSINLCKKENISLFIKEKVMGSIVNVDMSDDEIETGTFSKLLNGTAISCSGDRIFNDKLTYRSNAHYIKICENINKLRFNGAAELSYDHIICSGKLQDAKYEALDAYELFFLVTGFLNYGISLLVSNLTVEDETCENHVTPDQNETIFEFIKKFYDDTFDFKKASFSQKDDENGFAAIDTDIYPNYKEWFNSAYPGIQVCNNKQMRGKLKSIYIERKAGSELNNLSEAKRKEELNHRYYKNNKSDCRGISGLKLNETKFQEFLNQSQKTAQDRDVNRRIFAEYIQKEIFDKFSPYNKYI